MEIDKPAVDPRRPTNSLGEPIRDVADDVLPEWLDDNPPRADKYRELADEDYFELSSAGSGVEERPVRRRRTIPLILFGLTCGSTFLAGVSLWSPGDLLQAAVTDGIFFRQIILSHWSDGLLYMLAVLAILLAHEMGHFVAAMRHRIPASYPFFLPFPISPLGTLGAVIGMEGSRANRREIFDIGLAGPIAGLLLAVPMFILGLQRVDFSQHQFGSFQLDLPLAARWLVEWLNTPGYQAGRPVWQGQLNPLLMAGWVGLFVTGLNMLPVSQLDGGHVIYTLFRRQAHWIARGFMIFAVSYMLITKNYGLIVMIGLILFIGTDHPPTRDDSVPLGWARVVLGSLSLALPLLCFPPRVIIL